MAMCQHYLCDFLDSLEPKRQQSPMLGHAKLQNTSPPSSDNMCFLDSVTVVLCWVEYIHANASWKTASGSSDLSSIHRFSRLCLHAKAMQQSKSVQDSTNNF
eukprot:3324777-Amphidinium_carterae.1